LAELCASLDRVLIEAEGVYLAAKGEPVSPARRARRLVVHLRAGDFEATRAGLAAGAPQEFSFTWQLVGGILEGPDGDHADTVQPGGEGERLLGAVAAYLWGLPPSRGGSSPYDHALTALRRGDLVGGVLSLQLLEFAPGAEGPGPELFLYELLRRTFAGLAIAAIGDAGAPEANYLLAVAHGHLGRSDAARDLFRRAAQATGEFSLAALLFSPYTDAAEQRALARIHGGEVATAEGGPLQLLAVARTEGEVIAALERMQLAPGGFPADATDLAGLYGARRAAGARQAARVLWQVSADRQAMDVLERAHRKSSGYRPDFVNPPAFLADLARAHQRLGEYAPAVAALFELAAEYPSARVAYESLKRLYASRAGGEVPPR
jgi:hypothetical protein